ncbi:hypothetical protein [Aneurinibacillus tyrosinisolvens]|uniref:hypothetical protein n=1 Tax=Aneurinibacillus tyrosinisolvens TaxID=1443435 RepID=UPI00063F840A|nr:hypothetical protein [Aneurinibacillus tyrosinisolvens]
MAKNNKKKTYQPTEDRNKYNMRTVTSNQCIVCKQQCERGIKYMEKMAQPGAVGFGVPCILTKGKPYK